MSPTDDAMALPADRRLRLWIRPSVLALFAALALAPVVAAWVQYAVAGLPPVSGPRDPASADGPHGFPLWLRAAHRRPGLATRAEIRAGDLGESDRFPRARARKRPGR